MIMTTLGILAGVAVVLIIVEIFLEVWWGW